jgi:hypothetical protein
MTRKASETKSFPTAFPMGIGQPVTRALTAAGYARVEQLAGISEAALLHLHGVGPRAIRIIRQALAERDLPPLAR